MTDVGERCRGHAPPEMIQVLVHLLLKMVHPLLIIHVCLFLESQDNNKVVDVGKKWTLINLFKNHLAELHHLEEYQMCCIVHWHSLRLQQPAYWNLKRSTDQESRNKVSKTEIKGESNEKKFFRRAKDKVGMKKGMKYEWKNKFVSYHILVHWVIPS